MATYGGSLIEIEQFEDEKDLPRFLGATRDLARMAQLLVLGLKREEEAGLSPADYDDWALLHGILWPLEHAVEFALSLEREQRPARPVEREGDP